MSGYEQISETLPISQEQHLIGLCLAFTILFSYVLLGLCDFIPIPQFSPQSTVATLGLYRATEMICPLCLKNVQRLI